MVPPLRPVTDRPVPPSDAPPFATHFPAGAPRPNDALTHDIDTNPTHTSPL